MECTAGTSMKYLNLWIILSVSHLCESLWSSAQLLSVFDVCQNLWISIKYWLFITSVKVCESLRALESILSVSYLWKHTNHCELFLSIVWACNTLLIWGREHNLSKCKTKNVFYCLSCHCGCLEISSSYPCESMWMI